MSQPQMTQAELDKCRKHLAMLLDAIKIDDDLTTYGYQQNADIMARLIDEVENCYAIIDSQERYSKRLIEINNNLHTEVQRLIDTYE